MATPLPFPAWVPPCLLWVVGRGGRVTCECKEHSQNTSHPAKHNAPRWRITSGGSPDAHGVAGRTEGQSRASAGSCSGKAMPALAHMRKTTRADSDPGSFTAPTFSLEQILNNVSSGLSPSTVSINTMCVHAQTGHFSPLTSHHVCASRSGPGVPPALGSPARPKPDPILAPAQSRGSRGWRAGDDAIQEMQIPIYSTAPTSLSALRLVLESWQGHGAGTEGWVLASPHAGLLPARHIPAIPGDPSLSRGGTTALAHTILSPLSAPQKNKQLHNQGSQLPNPSLFFQNQEKNLGPRKPLLLGDH